QARSPSLPERDNVNPSSRQARGSDAPDLALIHPSIFPGGGGQADVCKDIEHRLAVSRCRLAIARQSNPLPVVGLEGHVQVEVDATITANPQIVHAVCPPRKAAGTAPLHRKIKPR